MVATERDSNDFSPARIEHEPLDFDTEGEDLDDPAADADEDEDLGEEPVAEEEDEGDGAAQ